MLFRLNTLERENTKETKGAYFYPPIQNILFGNYQLLIDKNVQYMSDINTTDKLVTDDYEELPSFFIIRFPRLL